MAIKKLPGQEEATTKKKANVAEDDKLNVREYIKKTNCKDGTPSIVKKCKLTMSGWLVIETEDWVGFIHGKASVSITLMKELAPQLHNKQGNQLVALISKKSKFGFVLGTDDEIKSWYCFNEETNLLEISDEKQDVGNLPTGILTLEDFLGT